MRKIGCLFFIIVVVGFLLVFEMFLFRDESSLPNIPLINDDLLESIIDSEENKETRIDLTTAPLHHYIGVSQTEIVKIYAKPERIDRSAYGYDWWVYPIDHERYIQFGILDEKVVTVLGTGEKLNSAPFHIGSDYQTISQIEPFSDIVEAKSNRFFRFELTESEVVTKPIIYYEGVWVQLYFDQFTQKLSSIRYIDEETLLKHRPYSITYRGTLPEAEPLSKEEWQEVEKGTMQQIFDITNMIRYRHHLNLLQWHEEAAKVAYAHSKDMSDHNYFSHTSPTKGELKDRLLNSDVPFIVAGENIASNYVDALSVVEGWLNSEGHRVNLLSDEFTHLGVGVFEKFYTQNFITPLDL